jgi:hypothetical protein
MPETLTFDTKGIHLIPGSNASCIFNILKLRSDLNGYPILKKGERGLGVLRLGSRFGAQRLEKACTIAQDAGITRYQQIEPILKNK